MSKTLYGLQIPALDGTRFLAKYVFEDEWEAQDAADEIEVEKDEVPAKVVEVRLIEKGEL